MKIKKRQLSFPLHVFAANYSHTSRPLVQRMNQNGAPEAWNSQYYQVVNNGITVAICNRNASHLYLVWGEHHDYRDKSSTRCHFKR